MSTGALKGIIWRLALFLVGATPIAALSDDKGSDLSGNRPGVETIADQLAVPVGQAEIEVVGPEASEQIGVFLYRFADQGKASLPKWGGPR